jgi:putative membrane protein
MPPQQRRSGLQAERTQLSWERSALGFLVGGAIPLLRDGGPLGAVRGILAVLAVVLALLVVWLGRVRGRKTNAGAGIVPPPRTEVLVLGWAVAGFAAAIVITLMLRWPA